MVNLFCFYSEKGSVPLWSELLPFRVHLYIPFRGRGMICRGGRGEGVRGRGWRGGIESHKFDLSLASNMVKKV